MNTKPTKPLKEKISMIDWSTMMEYQENYTEDFDLGTTNGLVIAYGVQLSDDLSLSDLTTKNYGNIILEVDDNLDNELVRVIGKTIEKTVVSYHNEEVSLEEAYNVYANVLNKVYPMSEKALTSDVALNECYERTQQFSKVKLEF